MPDIPMLNNIKDKVIPFLHKHQESLEEEPETVKSSGHPAADANNDVLRQFRISPETVLDNDVLTPSKVAMVKFREYPTRGFAHADVEQFHHDVSTSLQWYVKALEQRDKDVHRLATEIDKYITDYQNLRFELEVLQSSGGQAVVDDQGNYVTESQLSDEQRQILELEKSLDTLNNKLLIAEGELSDLKAKHADTVMRNKLLERQVKTAEEAPAAGPATSSLDGKSPEEIATLEQELESYRQWEKDVTVAYEEMENSLATKEKEIEALQESLQELKDNPLVVEQEPVVVQPEPVVIDNREELDAANERIRLLEEENEKYKSHITELDEYIDTLAKSIEAADAEEEPEDEFGYEDEFQQEAGTHLYSDHGDDAADDYSHQHPSAKDESAAGKNIVHGINLDNLPEGILPEDLFDM